MRLIKKDHWGISTILSFALIPLSGLATDIYLPSLPSMATYLNVSNAAVQLTLLLFMVSSGISQLFVGSLLDSFGRFRLGIAALFLFALASFTIALTHNIYTLYSMRVLQGIAVAIIVVGKRAYFMDVYSGEKLRHYTSLFSIVWATAPIVAPFLGGYLQAAFGWQSNFYFLGIFTLVIVVLELIHGGESLPNFHPFKLSSIIKVYSSMLRTPDFSLGLVIIALCYSMLVVFGMTSPFIIEHVFHYSPIVTGYTSLVSGVALMAGGIISKSFLQRPLTPKITAAIFLQLFFAGLMIAGSGFRTSLYTLIPFVLIIHLLAGFIFNNIFSYCLGRFSKNAGVASGITGGLMYILTSLFSYGIVNTVTIKSQGMLGGAYLTLALLLYLAFAAFTKVRYAAESTAAREDQQARQTKEEQPATAGRNERIALN